MQYSIPKGTFDILPDTLHPEDRWKSSSAWQFVESTMRALAKDYSFSEIRTPAFERTELFVRSVGESSDIVTKEMYTFEDKGGRSLTLRPEGTACVARAYIEKALYRQGQIHKLFYIGPMFRYERPQAGRYRQHHQFGVEFLGMPGPEADVEVIDMLCALYRRLGLHHLVVTINSVGDTETRAHYRDALARYLTPFAHCLSQDSQMRLAKNVLRILDTKNPDDLAVLEGAPSILDFLTPAARGHLDTTCALLQELHIDYRLNPRLVRGLDYYNHIVFEVQSTHAGAQNSIGGGGRYDGLISSLGGPETPAVGFATGIERLLQTLEKYQVPMQIPEGPIAYFIPLCAPATRACFVWLSQLRRAHVAADMDFSHKKLQHSLQMANDCRAQYSIIVGDEELATGQAQLKNMRTRHQTTIPFTQLVPELQALALS